MRIGIDTGGTFTDFVVFDGVVLRAHKVQSTPPDPSGAILRGLSDLGHSLGSPSAEREPPCEIVHGSTVATNALLERKGARVALVTTAGFEDVLLIARQTRRHLYDPFVGAPEPIVSAEQTVGLEERVVADGSIVQALDHSALGDLIDRL